MNQQPLTAAQLAARGRVLVMFVDARDAWWLFARRFLCRRGDRLIVAGRYVTRARAEGDRVILEMNPHNWENAEWVALSRGDYARALSRLGLQGSQHEPVTEGAKP